MLLTIKNIISLVAFLCLVVYGIIIMVKRLAAKRIPIKCTENGASIEFYNDVKSPDLDKRRMGSSFMINCNKQRLMLLVNHWGAELDYKLREDGFIEMIYSVREENMPKLMKLCENAQNSKEIVTYIYNRFSKDGYKAQINILNWLKLNGVEYSSWSNV